MAHQILLDGKLLPPEKAAGRLLPLDTMLRCPECNSVQVCAGTPRTVERIGLEYKGWIPRQQDRRCLECQAFWTVTLPPEVHHQLPSNNPFPR